MQAKKVKGSSIRARPNRKVGPQPRDQRRSCCPVACSLDIIGDRWSLLIVRDLVLGHSRFKDFSGAPEKIPTNVLSERLGRLLQHGIVRLVPVHTGSTRLGYKLTPKGRGLLPALRAIRDWGLRWEKDTQADRELVPSN